MPCMRHENFHNVGDVLARRPKWRSGQDSASRQADSIAVHRQCWHASSARSSRRASTRIRDPNPTTAVISSTSGLGADVMIRRTRGRWPVASIGPSCLIRCRVCSVVQGLSWAAGLDPASVSASTWANWLGHGGGPADERSPGGPPLDSGWPSAGSPDSVSGTASGWSSRGCGSSSKGGAASGIATRCTAAGSGNGAPAGCGRRRAGRTGTTSGRAGGWRVGNGNSGGRFSCMSGVLLGPGDISGGRNARGAKLVLVSRSHPRLPRKSWTWRS
jgi:hypothetical protein